jgi:hypothetical protein
VCIAFSRNAGPHSLVACYSVFKDRAPPLDAEPSSTSSLDCLAGVARTSGLHQGGRLLPLPPLPVKCDSLTFSPEMRRTARGRCLDQPLQLVKPASEFLSAACSARARLLPPHRVSRQGLRRFSSPSSLAGAYFPAPYGYLQPPRRLRLPRCVARGRFLVPLTSFVKK